MLRQTLTCVGLAVLCAAMAQGPPRHRGPGGPGGPGPQGFPPELRIFREMMEAEMKTSYSGTRTVFRNVEGKVEREIEQVLRDGPRTRVEFPSGSPRKGEVIVERGDKQWQWNPRDNTVRVGPARRRERLMEHFPRVVRAIHDGELKLETGSEGRVAGRKCKTVELHRKDGGLVWRMFIDGATDLLLKQEVFDPANPKRLIGGFEFTQIDFNVKPTDQDFVVDRPGAKVVSDEFVPIEQAQKRVPFRILRPPRVPDQFDPMGAKAVQIAGRPGVHLLFQNRDGVEALSIFEVQGSVEREALPGARRGYRIATRQVGEVFVAVIGKMDQSALQRLADSVR